MNVAPAELETIWANDMDGTLVDKDRVMNCLEDSIEAFNRRRKKGIDLDLLTEAKEKTELFSGQFNPIEYLKSIKTSASAIKAIGEGFINLGKQDGLLYDDARIYLKKIDLLGLPNLIFTKAKGRREWQMMKLIGSGLITRPYIITSQEKKGEEISSWRQDDSGLYRIQAQSGQVLVGHSVVLVDDRPSSFMGLPDDCEGYHIPRNINKEADAMGVILPPQVHVIGSLNEVPVTISAVYQ